MLTRIQQFESFIAETKEKPVYSEVQQMEATITLRRLETELKRAKKAEARDRPKVLLRLGVRYDNMGIDK